MYTQEIMHCTLIFNLIGPAAGEAVNEVETYPVIVLKMERREESVVF